MNPILPVSFSLTAVNLLAIYKSAFKNRRLTCDNFIVNNYLFLALTMLLMVNTVSVADHIDLELTDPVWLRLVAISFLMLLYIVFNGPPNNHLFYPVLFILLTLWNYKIYKELQVNQEEILTSLCYVIGITFFITAFVFKYPNYINTKYQYIISLIFILNILFSLINHFVLEMKTTDNAVSIIFILCYSAFIVYDTKNIILRKPKCDIKTINYFRETFWMMWDAASLFTHALDV